MILLGKWKGYKMECINNNIEMEGYFMKNLKSILKKMTLILLASFVLAGSQNLLAMDYDSKEEASVSSVGGCAGMVEAGAKDEAPADFHTIQITDDLSIDLVWNEGENKFELYGGRISGVDVLSEGYTVCVEYNRIEDGIGYVFYSLKVFRWNGRKFVDFKPEPLIVFNRGYGISSDGRMVYLKCENSFNYYFDRGKIHLRDSSDRKPPLLKLLTLGGGNTFSERSFDNLETYSISCDETKRIDGKTILVLQKNSKIGGIYSSVYSCTIKVLKLNEETNKFVEFKIEDQKLEISYHSCDPVKMTRDGKIFGILNKDKELNLFLWNGSQFVRFSVVALPETDVDVKRFYIDFSEDVNTVNISIRYSYGQKETIIPVTLPAQTEPEPEPEQITATEVGQEVGAEQIDQSLIRRISSLLRNPRVLAGVGAVAATALALGKARRK